MAKRKATPQAWAGIRHFKPVDFQCQCGNCAGKDIPISMAVVKKLDAIQEATAVPIQIILGCRCQAAQDRKNGGKSISAHLPHGDEGEATAVDIICDTVQDRAKLLHAAFIQGFTFIGIGFNFLHLEIGPTTTKPRVWLYRHGKRVEG